MQRKLWALTTVGALAAVVLMGGCGSESDGDGLPAPGSEAGEWCFANDWIDRASYDYGYWAGGSIPGPDAARKAMSYGSRLKSQYEQDKQNGDLPADLGDDELTAWVVNLATVQESTPVNTDDAGADNKVMDSYIDDVHAACN